MKQSTKASRKIERKPIKLVGLANEISRQNVENVNCFMVLFG